MTTAERKKLLEKARIPNEWWDLCIIDDNGVIHTPTTDVLYQNGLATDEEYQEWLKQIDNCSVPTQEERIAQLESEKAILAENVYQLASILEVMLGGTESGQTTATTTDTTN